MRAPAFLLLAMISAGFGFAQEFVTEGDLEKFQGSWQATLLINLNGKPSPEDDVKHTRLIVEGNQFTLQTKDGAIKGQFTIDSTRTPKTIDVVLEGQKLTDRFLGIYRIDGDERRSCFALPGRERPKDFDPIPGYLQFGWKRQAP